MNVHRGTVIGAIVTVNLFFCILHSNALYMEELRYNTRVTLHKKWEIHNIFKQKLSSTLNVKNKENPLSTLKAIFYIKNN